MAIAKVEPLTTARALRGPFDYRLPERLGEVGVGSVLLVPFGRRRVIGVVVDARRVERAAARAARRADRGAGGGGDARARPARPLGGPRVLLDPGSRAGARAAAQRGPGGPGPGPRLETLAAATDGRPGRAWRRDPAGATPAPRAREAGRRGRGRVELRRGGSSRRRDRPADPGAPRGPGAGQAARRAAPAAAAGGGGRRPVEPAAAVGRAERGGRGDRRRDGRRRQPRAPAPRGHRARARPRSTWRPPRRRSSGGGARSCSFPRSG